MLEHVLKKLWETKSGNTITHADYTTGVKGIEGALADHADEILNTKCGSEEQQKKVLDLMTRLVHISDTATPETDTRVRYPVTEGDYLLLKPFVDAHLLITSSKDINHRQQIPVSRYKPDYRSGSRGLDSPLAQVTGSLKGQAICDVAGTVAYCNDRMAAL